MCHNQDHPALSILKDCLAREVGKKSWHSQRMMADLSEAIALILQPKATVPRCPECGCEVEWLKCPECKYEFRDGVTAMEGEGK